MDRGLPERLIDRGELSWAELDERGPGIVGSVPLAASRSRSHGPGIRPTRWSFPSLTAARWRASGGVSPAARAWNLRPGAASGGGRGVRYGGEGTGSLAFSAAAAQSTYQALAAPRETNGCALVIYNDDARAARRRLSNSEGLLVELSSALTLAAARELSVDRVLKSEHRVVLLITSSGLEDVGMGRSDSDIHIVSPTLADLGRALEGHFGFRG